MQAGSNAPGYDRPESVCIYQGQQQDCFWRMGTRPAIPAVDAAGMVSGSTDGLIPACINPTGEDLDKSHNGATVG